MQLETWMGVQPGAHAGLGVDRGVVEHQVQVEGFRKLAVELAQEAQELLVAVPRAALADGFAVEDVERREETNGTVGSRCRPCRA